MSSVILTVMPGTPSAAQLPSADGVQTATVSGTVLDAESGRPLKNASVAATVVGSDIVQTTLADDAGAFTFSGLPSGRVRLSASKVAFVQPPWRLGRPATTFAVANGQQIRNVVVLLQRGGAISGTIRNADGKILPAADVRLYRCGGFGAGCDNPRPIQGGQSDRDGRYRFFGLPPGGYLVLANARPDGNLQQPIRGPASAAALDEAERLLKRGGNITAREMAGVTEEPIAATSLIATYFPSASEQPFAGIVTVGPGEERADVDVEMQTGVLGHISGMVRDERGQPFKTDRLQFFSAAGLRPIVTAPDGSFSVGPLPAGRGRLLLSVERPAGRRLMAETTIDVNGDVTNVDVQLRPTITITGRVALLAGAGIQGTDRSGVTLQLRRDEPRVITSVDTVTARSRPDGTFTFGGVSPGRYQVTGTVSQRQAGHLSIATVMADGRDVLDGIMDVSAGQTTRLTATLTARTTVVSGTVRDQAGTPVTDYLVVLFPADHALWTSARRVRSRVPASDGSFELTGTPAGMYLLALAGVGAPEDVDRSLLELLVPTARRIEIEAGRPIQMPLIIPSAESN